MATSFAGAERKASGIGDKEQAALDAQRPGAPTFDSPLYQAPVLNLKGIAASIVKGINNPGRNSDVPANNSLLPQYQVQAGPDVQYNSILPSAEKRLAGVGMTESPWLKLQMQQQQLAQQNAVDQAAQSGAGAAATARSSLAMRGGLSGGARERLAAGAQRNANIGRQGILRQGLSDTLGLKTADYGNQLGIANSLNAIEGTESGRTYDAANNNRNVGIDVNKFNTGNSLNALEGANNRKAGVYSDAMKEWAARQQALAIKNAG